MSMSGYPPQDAGAKPEATKFSRRVAAFPKAPLRL